MILLMPVGGAGERFLKAGYTIPKPLLPYQGKPLIQWAVESYLNEVSQWIFIVRPEMVREGIGQYLPAHSRIEVIRQKTMGPVETILSVQVDLNDELLIADCDSFLDAEEMTDALRAFRFHYADGGVTVRQTAERDCSYAKLSTYGWVKETREHDPFSPWSTTGPYWWKSGERFLAYASQAITDGIFSVSPVYNYLLKDQGMVKAIEVYTFCHLGTPEAYEAARNDRFISCGTSF